MSVIDQVLRLQRAQLQGVIELRGVGKMMPIYQTAISDLERKLRSVKGKDTFTAQHLRVTLAQAKDAVQAFEEHLAGHMEETGQLASTLSGRHLVASVRAFEKHFTGHAPVLQVAESGVFRKLYKGVEPSLLSKYKTSSKLYGGPVITKIQDQLALSMLKNEGVDAAVDRVMDTFEGERWRAERIVRTEMSYSYGVVKQRCMEHMRQTDVPDLKKKLIATFDNRTGKDSKKLHGQVRRVDEPFVWVTPKGKRVKYMQPPNRPNDREVVIPWRDGWDSSDIDEPGPVDPTLAGAT